MNKEIIAMLNRLHARLYDVSEVVDSSPLDLDSYAKKFDKIDDQVYLLMVEMEKAIAAAGSDDVRDESDGAADESLSASSNDKEAKGFEMSDQMKENLAGATHAINDIYKDGKEVVSELADAMSDIKGVFDFKSKSKK